MNTGTRGTGSGWSQVRCLRTGAALAAVASAALLPVPGVASAASQPIDSVVSSSPRGGDPGLPNIDSRASAPPARPDGATVAARTDLARALGPQGVIESAG
jgi:hypothetical protein